MKKVEKERIEDVLFKAGVSGDSLTFGRDGTITSKHGYFYRHGNSPEKIAARIKAALPTAVIVDARDKWSRWPKDSYFLVKFRLPGPEGKESK